MLANGEVDPLNERRVDLPLARRYHLLDGSEGPEHHTVTDMDQTPAVQGLAHLGIEQFGPRPPAGLRYRASCPLAGGLDPVPRVGQQGRRIFLESISEEERHTGWC